QHACPFDVETLWHGWCSARLSRRNAADEPAGLAFPARYGGSQDANSMDDGGACNSIGWMQRRRPRIRTDATTRSNEDLSRRFRSHRDESQRAGPIPMPERRAAFMPNRRDQGRVSVRVLRAV